MKNIGLLVALICLVFASNSNAMQGMEGMEHGDSSKNGQFVHTDMVDGIHASFEVMDLASMNMKDPAGKTHHVMATFMRDQQKLEKVIGKVKLIAPSGTEQVGTFKDFGSGVFAANFKIDEPGKWGVICLFEENGTTHTVKFWYPHMTK